VRAPSGGERQLIQVKVFDFDSALQRMSAVVWDPVAQRCFVSLKGSPEMVASLCSPGNGTQSTSAIVVDTRRSRATVVARVRAVHAAVPSNLKAQLEHYAHQGFRVMAAGYRVLAEVTSIEAAEAVPRYAPRRLRGPERPVAGRMHSNAPATPLQIVCGMRSEVAESQLAFAGLLVLENRLKPETLPALAVLRKANIRVVMATGTGCGCFADLCGDRT